MRRVISIPLPPLYLPLPNRPPARPSSEEARCLSCYLPNTKAYSATGEGLTPAEELTAGIWIWVTSLDCRVWNALQLWRKPFLFYFFAPTVDLETNILQIISARDGKTGAQVFSLTDEIRNKQEGADKQTVWQWSKARFSQQMCFWKLTRYSCLRLSGVNYSFSCRLMRRGVTCEASRQRRSGETLEDGWFNTERLGSSLTLETTADKTIPDLGRQTGSAFHSSSHDCNQPASSPSPWFWAPLSCVWRRSLEEALVTWKSKKITLDFSPAWWNKCGLKSDTCFIIWQTSAGTSVRQTTNFFANF